MKTTPCIILWQQQTSSLLLGSLCPDLHGRHPFPVLGFQIFPRHSDDQAEASAYLEITLTTCRAPARAEQLRRGRCLYSVILASPEDAMVAAEFFASHWVALWDGMQQLDGCSGFKLEAPHGVR